MSLNSGDRVGPYEIRARLGAGGMGEVYRAHDSSLGRDVALKLLPAECADDPDRLRRFEQEARSASALNHPAIVGIYELGRDAAQPYISMELVEGETLRQMLIAGPMPVRRALQIAAQVADGLAKAHDAGITHRDLKPENVMVSRDGFAKILDFGLAKLAAGPDDMAERQTIAGAGTQPGTVFGTVGYMSPEQASGQPADRHSDQFAFGLILYEMLTGQRAFARATPVETLSAIIREEPPPIGQHSTPVPAPVRWIVERCIAKQPSDRYASTRDLARDLAAARDGLSELTAQAAEPGTRARMPVQQLVAWALAVAFASSTAALWLRQRASSSPPDAAAIRFTMPQPASEAFGLNVGTVPFAVSPDGRQLAIATFGPSGRQLWLRTLDVLEPRPAPRTEGASNPFWSPDGTAIGFFADGKLKRLTLATGDVSVICDVRGGRRGGVGSTGAWSGDGTILFAGGLDVSLSKVAASGGVPTAVTTLDTAKEEGAHLSPRFLADGRRFLFRVMGGPNAGVYAASLDSAGRTRILTESSPFALTLPDHLLFIRDRILVSQRLDLARMQLAGEPVRVAEGVAITGPTAAFDASPSGTLVYWPGSQTISQPTWLRRDGTLDGTLGPPAAYVNLAISPDGKQVAIDRFDPQPAIWLLDVARGNATRATFGNGQYQSTPVWNPDGSGFVYAAGTDTPPNLFLKRLGATGEDARLFRTRLQSFPQSWSSGGHILYVTVEPTTSGDIWMVPAADGDRRPTPLLRTPAYESHPRVSPDGRWLAYQSDESGNLAVYVTAFPQPRGKWQVSTTTGGVMPVWSRDGRELFYRALDGTLMSVPVRVGKDFDTGVPVALFKSGLMASTVGVGTTYDVAPDGRFLYNKFVERTAPPATVVVNWPGILPREK